MNLCSRKQDASERKAGEMVARFPGFSYHKYEQMFDGGAMGWEYHNRHRSSKGRFMPLQKTERIQLRCTARQRDLIAGRAAARFLTMSEYLLDLVQRDLLREQYGLTADGKSV